MSRDGDGGGDERARAAYTELIGRAREVGVLGSCAAVLAWDEQTYMPPGGAAHRGEQMALLAGLQHERTIDPRIGELLQAVEESELVADPESAPAVNARELRRGYERRRRLPRDLVEALARTTSMAQQEWVLARRESRFDRFRPRLEEIIGLERRQAECLKDLPEFQAPGCVLYDVLLDAYEPGARVVELAPLFQGLREHLAPLAARIQERSAQGSGTGTSAAGAGSIAAGRTWPVGRQRIFAEAVAAAVGFDFRRGRLDVTAHPFCTGIGPGDTRITTRYDEHQFSDAFFGVLHEVGHGLYEQGLPADQFGTPMGESASLGVHESQSRLWENAVGRCRAFWTHWFPMARQVFHDALHDVSLDQFLLAINRVTPSLIRVQADEVTYNLHILIRFELEQALLDGGLPVADLPAAWNEKYRQTLGITPPDDASGCLQDIHWSAGLFGYFPTYTLGNVYAAQLFAAARAELAGMDASFARGDFSELLSWLRDKVHRQAQRFRPAALIERATGARPDPRPLVESLERKYVELYGL